MSSAFPISGSVSSMSSNLPLFSLLLCLCPVLSLSSHFSDSYHSMVLYSALITMGFITHLWQFHEEKKKKSTVWFSSSVMKPWQPWNAAAGPAHLPAAALLLSHPPFLDSLDRGPPSASEREGQPVQLPPGSSVSQSRQPAPMRALEAQPGPGMEQDPTGARAGFQLKLDVYCGLNVSPKIHTLKP